MSSPPSLTLRARLAGILCVALIAIYSASPGRTAIGATERVLVTFENGSHHPAIESINRSLQSTYRTRPPIRIELYSQFLDSRVPLGRYEQELVPLLHRKYDGRKFDLTFAVLATALKLVLRNGKEIFPNTAIAFLAVDDVRYRQPSLWELYKSYAIIITAAVVLETLLILWLLVMNAKRKKAEQARENFARLARDEHTHLNDVVSNVPGIVWESRVAPDTKKLKTVFVSQYLEKMLGYSVEEWLSTTGFELGVVHDSDREALIKTSDAIFASGGEGNLQYRCLTKDGRTLWVQTHFTAIRDDNGKSVGLRGMTLDVTEQKLAEAALNESEENYRSVFNAANDAIFVHAIDTGNILDANKRMCEMYGVTLEEVKCLTVGDLSANEPPYTQEVAMACIQKAAQGDPQLFDWRAKDKSGRLFWVEVNLKRASVGGKAILLAVVRDITERKHAEEEIRFAKDELRLIADSLPVLVSQTDRNGYYRFNNLAFETWFGEPRDQMIGRHMREVLGEEAWTRSRPHIERALAGEEIRYEDLLVCRRGAPRWVSVVQIPMRDATGDVNGVVSLVSDITESRRSEQTLRDLSGRLITAQEEERSRVARELHDDLSQRMALLSIELEQLSQQVPGPHGILELRIEKLLTEAKEIAGEIHRLAYQLHPSKLEHLGLVAAVRSLCHEISEHHGIEIDFCQSGYSAVMSSDITLCVFRIAQEALTNIVKHSGASKAVVTLGITDDLVQLTVSDTGCGFDTTSNKMTSGLGFTGMKERLRLIGGQLSIQSDFTRGTRIEVSVPLKEVARKDHKAHVVAGRR